MSRAYYNEIDPFAAEWLRWLINAGEIAPGDVDERDIRDVKPSEIMGYTQCHFFAGIGVWSKALRDAGWPDDRPVWTASCPCQPFSAAGAGRGIADERHLWPHLFYLWKQCNPVVTFGEQVASKDGLAWLDIVQTDLERAGATVGAVDTCAAGFGAPHIRQRTYWVAHNIGDGSQGGISGRPDTQRETINGQVGRGGTIERLAHHDHNGRDTAPRAGLQDTQHNIEPRGGNGGLANTEREQRERRRPGAAGDEPGSIKRIERFRNAGGVADTLDSPVKREVERTIIGEFPESSGTVQTRSGDARPPHSHWRDADWLACRDGKWRPVEPGSFPLAHGAASRVGRLRGYGNAIVKPQAEEFIRSYIECTS